jgi:hypothetical protein
MSVAAETNVIDHRPMAIETKKEITKTSQIIWTIKVCCRIFMGKHYGRDWLFGKG